TGTMRRHRRHKQTVEAGLIAVALFICPSWTLAPKPGGSATEGATADVPRGKKGVGNGANCDDRPIVICHTAPERRSLCPAPLQPAIPINEARSYLIATAQPGYTMTLQGPEVAIGRLHPEFAQRLAGAIREARGSGLGSTGIFSAYRPPAFGIG